MPTTSGNVIAFLMTEIENQLQMYGINPAELHVTRGSQPTDQYIGANSQTYDYLVMLTPATSSWIQVARNDTTDGQTLTSNYNHTQQLAVQIDCLTNFTPAGTVIEAQDFAEILSNLLGHNDTARNLRENGVGVMKVGNVRPSYTIMDGGDYESTPSFDLTVTYESHYTKEVPAITLVDGTVNGVL